MNRLWERRSELSAIEGLVSDAGAGQGRMLLLEGPAGIGKTALLKAAAQQARGAGLTVLSARGAELERAFAFGVARQLLERVVLRRRGDERERLFADAAGLAAPVFGLELQRGLLPPTDAEQAALMGLYWLLVAVAEERAVVVVIDDLQWADATSLAWLAYTARRIGGLPIGVVATARSGERALGGGAWRVPDSDVAIIRPRPLSASGVNALLADVFGAEPAPEVRRACTEVTGGNPFLVLEVARALRAAAAAGRLEPSHVDVVRSERLDRFVEARLAGLSRDAARLARAVAVLDSGTELRHAARLVRLDRATAVTSADVLRAADVLSPAHLLEFAHPIIRRVVYDAIPPGQRAEWHGRAAQMLADEHAPPERVAAHLRYSEPTGDHSAVRQLREASHDALSRGAPGSAVQLLRRALREGVAAERGALLLELGLAESRVHDPAAIAHLEEARSLAREPRMRAEIALALARALINTAQAPRAFSVLERSIPDAAQADSDLAMRLEAALCATARLAPGWADRVAARVARLPDDLAGDSPGERALLACLAGEAGCRGTSAERAVAFAERALAGGRLLAEETPESPFVYHALTALTWADRYAVAREHAEAALADAQARGSPLGSAQALTWRAEIALREGALRNAEADAAAALDLAHRHGEIVTRPLAVAWLVLSLLEQGRTEAAGAALATEGFGGELPEFGLFAVPAFARGRLRRSLSDPRAALDDFDRALRVTVGLAASNPGMLPIRSAAAEAHAALGEHDAARALAAEEVARAQRFGAPRAIGIALHAKAMVGERAERVEGLREAVSALDSTGAHLSLAQALCDFGVALRQSGRASGAREPLRLALDLAARCEASPLVKRARQELLATGGRPRRVRATGRDALTPSELRVAELAARGMTNREIAQALFVTLKTVETHLSHAYSKLDLHSRQNLSRALSPPALDDAATDTVSS